MLFSPLVQLCANLIDLLRVAYLSSDDKDLERLILRQQLNILGRTHDHNLGPVARTIGKWVTSFALCNRLSARDRDRLASGIRAQQ